MRRSILFFLLTLWRVCHAGWPCCLRCNRNEDREVYAPVRRQEPRGSTENIRATSQPSGIPPRGSLEKTPSSGLALDLTNPDRNIFFVREKTSRAYKYYDYVSKSKYRKRITSIVDGTTEIWKGEVGETLEDCTVYTKDGYSPILRLAFGAIYGKRRYMLQHDGTWKDIEEEEFVDRLYRMKEELPERITRDETATSDGIILDILKPDASIYDSFYHDYDTVPTKMIIPHGGQSITKLVDGSVTIWMAEEGERCTRCGVHMKGGEPVLVYIERETSAGISLLILSKDDGEWKTPDSYADELTKLRVPVSDPSAFTLDISLAASTSQCTIFDALLEGIPASLYFPKNGHHAKEIKDGNNPVWKGGEEERAFSVKVYKRDGSPHLLYIASRESNVGCSINRFLKDSDGKWIEICKDEFEKRIEEIPRGESKTP